MNITIDWMPGLANRPEFIVECPPIDSGALRYVKHGNFYRAISDPLVHYLYRDNAETCHGFGGHEFQLNMLDGSHVTLKGAWSSRAACLNEAFPTMPVVDVCANREHIGMLASSILDWWASQGSPTWGLALTKSGREYMLQPTRNGALKPDTLSDSSIVFEFTPDNVNEGLEFWTTR